MKRKFLALALLAGSTGVFAQSNPFEGFSAGVSVSSVGASTTLTDSIGSINMGQQSIVPTVEVGYMYGISKDIGLGVTFTYDLADTKAGSLDNFNMKGKNHYSINLKPGYVVGNSTMIYALVGYNSTKGTASYEGYSTSTNYNGVGAGLGIQTLLTKNLYVKLEAQQVTYNSKSFTDDTGDTGKFKPSATIGTIGIGYKF